MADFESGGLGNIGADLLAEPRHVVREDGGFVASAGDRYVAEPGTEQVRMSAGIGVDEHALGRESLGAVAGNGVAVVEVAMLRRVEFEPAVIV